MPATHKVSVGWQIVFTFIPIVNFWAFYRVRKLGKYLLYVFLPAIVVSTIIGVYFGISAVYNPQVTNDAMILTDTQMTPFGSLNTPELYASIAVSIAFKALEIYLVVLWSNQHNTAFDQANQFQKP